METNRVVQNTPKTATSGKHWMTYPKRYLKTTTKTKI
jgi:hypothetical protein